LSIAGQLAKISALIEKGSERASKRVKTSESSETMKLGEAVASFLYWSCYLHNEEQAESILITRKDGSQRECGTLCFRRLLEALDENCPDWRTFNSNYVRPEKRTASEDRSLNGEI